MRTHRFLVCPESGQKHWNGHLHGDLTSINIAENEGAGHVDTLWDNKIGLMDDTWLQWCYKEMSVSTSRSVELQADGSHITIVQAPL